eukprot:1001545-Amphidinium_carterae.1
METWTTWFVQCSFVPSCRSEDAIAKLFKYVNAVLRGPSLFNVQCCSMLSVKRALQIAKLFNVVPGGRQISDASRSSSKEANDRAKWLQQAFTNPH